LAKASCRIRGRRKQLKMRQDQLALATGVGRRFPSHWNLARHGRWRWALLLRCGAMIQWPSGPRWSA